VSSQKKEYRGIYNGKNRQKRKMPLSKREEIQTLLRSETQDQRTTTNA
jgi:hypothetical protein